LLSAGAGPPPDDPGDDVTGWIIALTRLRAFGVLRRAGEHLEMYCTAGAPLQLVKREMVAYGFEGLTDEMDAYLVLEVDERSLNGVVLAGRLLVDQLHGIRVRHYGRAYPVAAVDDTERTVVPPMVPRARAIWLGRGECCGHGLLLGTIVCWDNRLPRR
jgi:hypothetical protein